MSFLVDTDICSAQLKNKGVVTNRFLQHRGRLYISSIALGELHTWTLRANAEPKRQQSLLDLLNDVTLLSIDDIVASKFGELRARLLDLGQNAPQIDLLNAATALVHGLTPVTHNTKDFANVPGLTVVDWLVP